MPSVRQRAHPSADRSQPVIGALVTLALILGAGVALGSWWDLRRLKSARKRALRIAKQQIPLVRRSPGQLLLQRQEIERTFTHARRRTLAWTGMMGLCIALALVLGGR